MLRLYIALSILIPMIFLSLGLLDMLKEKQVKKKYLSRAFFLSIRYLFFYPFIKLPFIINKNRSVFGINELDFYGKQKSRIQIYRQVIKTSYCISKEINLNYSRYMNDNVKIIKSFIKRQETLAYKEVCKRRYTKEKHNEKNQEPIRLNKFSAESLIDTMLKGLLQYISSKSGICNRQLHT